MSTVQAEPASGLRFAEAELTERLGWFIRLRWLAAAGVVAGTAAASWVLEVPVGRSGLLGVALLIAGCNVVFHAWRRVLMSDGDGAIQFADARKFAHAQIAADLVCLGIILHCSGGIENPLSFFFAFHMIIASMLLSRAMAYAQATLATAIYATVVGLERFGVIDHFHLGLFSGPEFHTSEAVWLIVAAFAATLYLIVYMTTSITGRLRDREREAGRLTQELAENAQALQAAYDELQAAQKLQITYMRKTSHELRSPLAAVASTLDVMAEGFAGEMPQKQREMLDRARQRIKALMRLVNDLLALLRSRAAPPRERFQPVGLEHVVESVTELQADRAEQEGVSLVTDIPAGLPPVWGDDELLDQLCTNLIANAIKYTSEGGEVRVSLDSDDGSVTLRVADTGIGIAPEDQNRIFEEFYRAKRGREFTARGTGLGLAIVKSIVDAHDATIAIESEVGKGTTFTVVLPRGDGRNGRSQNSESRI